VEAECECGGVAFGYCSHPAHFPTGCGGYFGNRSSTLAFSHIMKTEPRALLVVRKWRHVWQMLVGKGNASMQQKYAFGPMFCKLPPMAYFWRTLLG
jgi:hypothetical protein